MIMKNFGIILAVVAVVIVGAGAWLITSWEGSPEEEFVSEARRAACEQFLIVAIFPDGAAADEFMEACLRGEPVLPDEMEELPPMGDEQEPIVGPVAAPGCAVGGCSSQICGEAGEVEDIATTCEWREEYACYAAARCEKQLGGRCGWTATDGYNQCIADVSASY